MKVLIKLFLKVCEVEGAEPSLARRQAAGNFASQKFPSAEGEISSFGGELAKRFADLEQILFSFGQILRSRFAAEKHSVKRNCA